MKAHFHIIFLLLFCTSLLSQSFEHLAIDATQTTGLKLISAFSGGLNSPQFSEVDLDGNGEKDLYVFDRIGNIHLTFLKENTGDEIKYRFEPRFAKNFPNCYDWVLLRDYNGDNIVDLFTYSGQEGVHGIRVFKGKYSTGKIAFSRVELGQGFDFNVLIVNDVKTEIFVSNIDYPAIADMDGDGDLDILNYEKSGVHVHYFENQAIENGYPLDSLVFLLKDDCWGRFSENTTDEFITLGSNIDDCPEWTNPNIHPGSTLLLFDENGDGLMEILIGDNSSSKLTKLTNNGTKEIAFMTEIDTLFPNYDLTAEVDFFANSFLFDVDNDNISDLIVAPNLAGYAENYHVGWFYKNTGNNENHVFEYQQSDWLIQDMFDFGSRSAPAFADVNADGLLDIIIGNESFYLPNSKKDPRLVYLENIGTSTEPNFSLKDDNWLNFKQFDNYTTDFTPAFGDVDGDGDLDLLVGEKFGSLFFVENHGGANNPMEFDIITHHWQDIDIGQFSAPQIGDLNRDGLLDLLIGDRFGNLNFFPNIGTPTLPQFHPITDENPNNPNFGEIDTSEPFTTIGHSVPFLIDMDSSFILLTGESSGKTNFYQFNSDEINNPLLPIYLNWGNTKSRVGVFSKPAVADLNSDGVFDLIMGNQRGGLTAFQSHLTVDGITSTSKIESKNQFKIYPNPVIDYLNIESKNIFRKNHKTLIINNLGETILTTNKSEIDLISIPKGIYFLKVEQDIFKFVKI